MVFAIFQIRDYICLNWVKDNRNEDKAHSIDMLEIELTALEDMANDREKSRMTLKLLVQMTGWTERPLTVEIQEQLAAYKRRP